nr:NAD-dependent epimerase/dehydratase family protein [Oxalobacteraceae bacterium]
MIIVTGGAGFIGSNFVLEWVKSSQEPVLVLDCLSYAGNLENLAAVSSNGRFDQQVLFSRTDLRNFPAVQSVIQQAKPRAIVHFAAESHVDRSIDGPGDGRNIRDWLYVRDHCLAIKTVLRLGRVGEVYNIGGDAEMNNLEVVHRICALLDELKPRCDGRSYSEQIEFVKDRPGHDRRYAIDASKIRRELGWSPEENFDSGIRKTIQWYLKLWDNK